MSTSQNVFAGLLARKCLSEKKMFGELAFLLHGNMSCGIHGDGLIVRLDPETTDSALDEPGTRVFDITGRLVGHKQRAWGVQRRCTRRGPRMWSEELSSRLAMANMGGDEICSEGLYGQQPA